MEQLAQPSPFEDGTGTVTIPPVCANVYFHLDEVEFDSWTYFVAADALILSPSTFSYVPALIRHDNVYYPNSFWHPISSSFIIFDAKTGTILTHPTNDEVAVPITSDAIPDDIPINSNPTNPVEAIMMESDANHNNHTEIIGSEMNPVKQEPTTIVGIDQLDSDVNVTTTIIIETDLLSMNSTTGNTISDPNDDNVDYNETPWRVIIAHEPRYDLLGSFVLPTLYLYSITQYLNWTLQIFPFAGSTSDAILTDLFAQKGNLSKDWGNGFQDASHRVDYNPMELNDKSYDTIGFFPEVSKDLNIRSTYPWIRRDQIPQPGKELHDVCKVGNTDAATTTTTTTNNNLNNSTEKECYILLSEDTYVINNYINMNGGIDVFFTSALGEQTRRQFLLKNQHRLQQYEIANQTSSFMNQNDTSDDPKYFNVAVHIRRGDILDPNRWIDQEVFANVAKYICQSNTAKNESIYTNIHVFSSGPNRDGNWSIMERLTESSGDENNEDSAPICANVYFHFDELEFDSWTYMIAADALVISPSTFSYVPGLIRRDNVYYPNSYWHPALSSFIVFNHTNGNILTKP
jgi:hypothetical protein